MKLPKTFLAVNLSDAFSFQERERSNSEHDVLEMKAHDRSTPAAVEGGGESEMVPADKIMDARPLPVGADEGPLEDPKA